MRKRIISFVLVLALIFSVFIPVTATSSTTLSVSSKSGYRGDAVNLSVNISSGSMMQACSFELYYDKNVVEIISVEKGSLIANGTSVINKNTLGKIVMSYVSTTGAVVNSGSLMNIVVRIKDDARYGSSALTLISKEMSDGNFNAVNVSTIDGTLNVIAPALEAPNGLLSHSTTSDSIELYWNEVVDATGYNVYVNGEKKNSETIVDNVYLVEGLEQNTEYEFSVSSLHYGTESEQSGSIKNSTDTAYYYVTFVDWRYVPDFPDLYEGYEIITVRVKHGEGAEAPTPPLREGYIFTGWDIDFTNITSDTIVQAQYEAITCKVSYVDWDGTVLKSQTVNYGENATPPENPTREGYLFAGWDKVADNVTEDITVTATYSTNVCMHTKTETKNATTSTCITNGYGGDLVCVDCGKVIANGGELELAPHKYVAVVTAPTPTAQGYTTHTCSVCNDSYIDTYTDYVSETDPQIVVSTAKGTLGKEVAVTISLKNNPGIASMTLQLDYDSDVLTLKSVTDGGNLGTAVHSDQYTSPYTLCWVNDTAKSDYTYNGDIVTLTFEIAEEAEVGRYPVKVSYNFDNYDIYNVNIEKVEFQTVNGYVDVENVIIGDVNGDEIVNNLDRVVLTRYLANWADYPDSKINMAAADVNYDGLVNNFDRVVLTRHLANWTGYTELPYTS